MMTNAIETPPLMKLSLAKAQLVTALDLFVRNKDPISVHALRAAVERIIEGVAETQGEATFATHIRWVKLSRSPADEVRRSASGQ